MRSYHEDVRNDATEFLLEHEEMIVAAIEAGADWDYNDIDDLDEEWHNDIVDRAYSLSDAVFVLENCDNQETDSGLWEGKSAEEAIPIQAAYSYSNDVWFEAKGLYEGIKERFEELMGEQEEPDEGALANPLAKQAFEEFRKEEEEEQNPPVEQGSDDEISLIRRWLRLNEQAGGLWGGYPAGSSYIDARCGTGQGMPEVKGFVDFDHEFARRVPWLAGKYKRDVQARLDCLIDKTRPNMPPEVAWGAVLLFSKDSEIVSGYNPSTYRESVIYAILCERRFSPEDIREMAEALKRRV